MPSRSDADRVGSLIQDGAYTSGGMRAVVGRHPDSAHLSRNSLRLDEASSLILFREKLPGERSREGRSHSDNETPISRSYPTPRRKPRRPSLKRDLPTLIDTAQRKAPGTSHRGGWLGRWGRDLGPPFAATRCTSPKYDSILACQSRATLELESSLSRWP